MKPLLITLALAHGADVGTTVYGLGHGATEVVLPTQNPAVISAIVAGEYSLEAFVLARLNTSGHAKLARMVGWTLVGVRGSIAAHNWQAVKRLR